MKKILLLSFFVVAYLVTVAQTSKIEKSVSEKLPDLRKEYDDASFIYAFSSCDKYHPYENKERYEKQIKLFQAIEKLNEEHLTNGLEDISLLNDAGEMLYASQMYTPAEKIFKTVIHTHRENGKIKSQQYSESLSNLSLLYHAMGRVTLAEIYCDSAYQLRKEIFPTESSQFGISVNNMAVLKKDLGLYAEAEELIDEAVRIHEKALTKKSLPYALSLNNQAMLYQSMGKLKEAEPIMLEAIKIAGDNLKEKSINYGKLMTNLALLYQEMEKYADAEIIFLKIVKLKENSVGVNHPDYAHAQHLLASLYIQMDKAKQDQVEGQLKRISLIYKKTLGDKNPLYASAINDLGNYYRFRGNTKVALPLLQEALQIRKEELNQKNPDLINTIENLGLTYWQMNKMVEASKTLKESADKTIANIGIYQATMSEAEISKFWYIVNSRMERFYAFALLQTKSALSLADEALEYRLKTKGIVINHFAKSKIEILKNDQKELREHFQSWLDTMENLARLYKLSNEELEEEGVRLDTLENHVKEHFDYLILNSPGFEELYNIKKTTFKQTKDQLMPDEAAVEILSFKNSLSFKDSICYAALIVTKERISGPEVILFHNGNELEKYAFNNYKSNIKQKIKDEKSYSQFYHKIAHALNNKKIVYLSTSGVFNQINFNTFLTPSGKYLIDEKNIITIENLSDIIRIKEGRHKNNSSKNAALFGYPDFGVKGIVPRLPGTKVEVEFLKDYLSTNGYSASLYLQNLVTEQKIKSLQNVSIVHIATHGSFIEPKLDEQEYVFGLVPNGIHSNPYLMSGLLVAGAEKELSGDSEDGILRASEIAKLSLNNTELVYLSSIETLYGNKLAGDGLAAIQRAFRIAGSSAVIISLWKLNDANAQSFINSFYEEYIKNGNVKIAFTNTIKNIREKNPDPYFWGSYQLFQ